VDEQKIIDFVRKSVSFQSPGVIMGIGDDTAVLKYDTRRYLLATTDTLVGDVHYLPDYFTPKQVGIKAIESNVSDIAAMGGVPTYAMISLILPRNTDKGFIQGLYSGIRMCSNKYKISIIGGNVSRGNQVSITTQMMGFVDKKNLCLREDAEIGDLICVTGMLGASKVGLELLKLKKLGKSINAFLNPKSNLQSAKKIAKYANAMEDISDGLATEIKNICKESKTGAKIYKNKIPIKKSAIKDSKILGKDPINFALYGGEDYEIVFTIPKKNVKYLEKRNCKIYILGKILPKKEGIFLMDDGRKTKLGSGYNHL
jgi:thiamine-monophosphate kinase